MAAPVKRRSRPQNEAPASATPRRRSPPAGRRPEADEQAAPARRASRPTPAGAVRRPRSGPLRRTLRGGRLVLVARIGALCLAAGGISAGAYAAALDTSMFAVSRVVIIGGSSPVDAQVRAALAPQLGRSLLKVSGAAVDRAAAGLPDVVSLRFVRSFPHTLRVFVTPEHPVLLIRRGKVGYVVSARGRVMARSARPLASRLPRLWVPPGDDALDRRDASPLQRPHCRCGGGCGRAPPPRRGCPLRHRERGRCHPADADGFSDPARRHRRAPAQAHDRRAHPPLCRGRDLLRRVRRCECSAAPRARLQELSSRKYRLMVSSIECCVFRIDKRGPVAYSALEGPHVRSQPALKLEIERP